MTAYISRVTVAGVVEGEGGSKVIFLKTILYMYIWKLNIHVLFVGSDCPICWEKMDSKQELKAKLVCQHGRWSI